MSPRSSPALKGRRFAAALALLAPGLFQACSILPEPALAPRTHDLGPLPALTPPEHTQAGAIPPGGVFAGIEGPGWTSSTEIHYRFLHLDPTQVRVYAHHRWIASPAALLDQRLRELLGAPTERAAAPAEGSRYRWRATLEVFEQQFTSASSAQALLRLRARLTLPDGADVVRVFEIRRPCAPTVEGAVDGLASAGDAVIRALLAWLSQAVTRAPRDVSRPSRRTSMLRLSGSGEDRRARTAHVAPWASITNTYLTKVPQAGGFGVGIAVGMWNPPIGERASWSSESNPAPGATTWAAMRAVKGAGCVWRPSSGLSAAFVAKKSAVPCSWHWPPSSCSPPTTS